MWAIRLSTIDIKCKKKRLIFKPIFAANDNMLVFTCYSYKFQFWNKSALFLIKKVIKSDQSANWPVCGNVGILVKMIWRKVSQLHYIIYTIKTMSSSWSAHVTKRFYTRTTLAVFPFGFLDMGLHAQAKPWIVTASINNTVFQQFLSFAGCFSFRNLGCIHGPRAECGHNHSHVFCFSAAYFKGETAAHSNCWGEQGLNQATKNTWRSPWNVC